MSMEIDTSLFFFRTKEIWFSDFPYDVKGYHSITFYQCRNKIELAGFTCSDFTTIIIDLTQPLELIWLNMSSSSCRKSIKRAVREGIKISVNEHFEPFLDLLIKFRKLKSIPGEILSIQDMKRYGTLFTAHIDHQIIAGVLFLEDCRNIRGLFGCSIRLEATNEVSGLISCGYRLIFWEAIKYAKSKSMLTFDFGGYYTGSNPDDPRHGINRFKTSFGGQLTTHYTYTKYYSKFYASLRTLYHYTIDVYNVLHTKVS